MYKEFKTHLVSSNIDDVHVNDFSDLHNVTIHANERVLDRDTIIITNSVIGNNGWITK